MSSSFQQPAAIDRADRAQTLVSFVIPVRNDPVRLRRCLTTIRANAPTNARVEIVVADNGSTDDTPDVARSFGARVLSLPGLSVAALRNRAAMEAQGEVLAFVDADHEIDPEWVASAVDALSEDGVAAVGALCFAPSDGTWVQRGYDALRGRTEGRSDVEWLGSGNMAVRRDLFDNVGGFDVSLETCEDVDLCSRLRQAGLRVRGDDRLRNVHLGDPSTLGKLWRSELWRGRDNLRVSLRYGITLRGLPSILIPIVELACLIAWPLAMLGLFLTVLLRGDLLVAVLLSVISLASSHVLVALTLLRVVRMARWVPQRSALDLARAFIVAGTYDLARAVALLARARHHQGRQPERKAATS
jgi:glycosyltransferase involved in cell wall biosynthesis